MRVWVAAWWFACGFMSAHLGLFLSDEIDGGMIMAGVVTLILMAPLALVAAYVSRKFNSQ